MIWPFVQGYYAWAASKEKNVNVFMTEMDKCAQLWGHTVGGEFREFYRPDSIGTPDGGDRQLWSAAGYISMVFHGLFGMNFDVDGIRFDPVVPDTFKNGLTLNKFIYRKDTLNMTISGTGIYLQTFSLDGVQTTPFFAGTMTGKHTIIMTMGNTPLGVRPQTAGSAIIADNRIKVISSTSMPGVNLNFGTYHMVKASLFSLTGRCVGKFTTSCGTVTIGSGTVKPGTYVVQWRSGDVDGLQKVLLK